MFTGSYIAMEAEARVIRAYAQAVVPGIFQVPAYARAVISAARPWADEEEVGRRVAARAARQEAVLWRAVGGPGVHRAQLEALCAAAGRPGVTVQVLPFTAGATAGMDGKFTLLEFAGDPQVAYVEGLMSDVYVETANGAARYADAFELLACRALGPGESARMISEITREKAADADL